MKSILNTLLLLTFAITTVSVDAQKPYNGEVTVDELKYTIEYLASDALKGRRAGSPDALAAAHFISRCFKDAGLQLMGDNGLQSYEIVVDLKYGENNHLGFGRQVFSAGNDFNPYPFSSNGSLDAQVVFAGYGFQIDDGKLQWDDYKNIDAKGKWVMILRGDPKPDEDEDEFINYSSDRGKVLIAKDNGASGVLFVSGPVSDPADNLTGLYFDKTQSDAGIPVIHIKREVANIIIEDNGLTIETLERETNNKLIPLGFAISKNVKGGADVRKQTVTDYNVVALLKVGHSGSYIVAGAHYDHLGMGGPGSGSRVPDTLAPHNGADDNASGVAGIIEMAEKLAMNKNALNANVLFIAFGGEEMGLLGSSHFVKNPLIGLDSVKVMVNFDMIGRLDEAKRAVSISGTGTAEEMEQFLDAFEKNYTLSFSHSPEGYGPSDHAAFYSSDIPVLFISTGAHSDYHTPADDAEYINFEGQKEVTEFAANLIVALAGNNIVLTYQEAGPKRNVGYRGKLKVTLGIMPDFTAESNEGLPVGGVTPNRPAAKSGMQKGDIIVAMDGKSVGNIYDYMNRLKTFIPGQIVTVDVMRDGKKMVFIVQLD